MEQVAELAAQGLTQRKIAEELGISVGKVNNLLKRAKAQQAEEN